MEVWFKVEGTEIKPLFVVRSTSKNVWVLERNFTGKHEVVRKFIQSGEYDYKTEYVRDAASAIQVAERHAEELLGFANRQLADATERATRRKEVLEGIVITRDTRLKELSQRQTDMLEAEKEAKRRLAGEPV